MIQHPVMRRATRLLALIALTLPAIASGAEPAPAAVAPMTDAQMVGLLETIDAAQKAVGDYTAHAFINQKEKGKREIVYESVVYRRDGDDKLVVLFLAPKTEAGKGYLRIDDNLWLYAPTTGKWERRTERERIAGTDSRRADFDESRLAAEYTPSYLGAGTLGRFATHKLKLTAKDGVDVAWPVVHIDVDVATKNILKRQEYALSGRLMRTSFFPKWHQVTPPGGGAPLWYPKEMHFYDEVDKGNATVVKIDSVDLRPLDKNLFTKAWIETQSR